MRERRSPQESARSSSIESKVMSEPDWDVLKDKELERSESSWVIISSVSAIISMILVTLVYFENKKPPETTQLHVNMVEAGVRINLPKLTFPPEPSYSNSVHSSQAQLPRFLGGGELVNTSLRLISFDLLTFGSNPFSVPLEGSNTLLDLNSELFSSSKNKNLISDLLTNSMYEELKETLAKSGSIITNLDNYWKLSKSMTFQEFVMSPQNLAHIQRLDRQTSPFIGKFGPYMRPVATTCFEQLEVGNVTKWFQEQWMKFIFQVEATSPVSGRQGTIYGLTRESQCTGEALVALAVYDTMMMSILSGSGKAGHYHEVRQKQCALLTEGSQKSFLNLLEEGKQNFRQVDVIILRNINAELAEKIRTSEFGRTQFELKVPRSFNKLSNDNPAILLRIGRFLGAQEVIIDAFEDGVEDYGRSFVCSATRLDTSQTLVLLASLSSRKALEVVHDEVILKESSNRMLLAGIASDALSEETHDRELAEVSTSISKENIQIYDLFGKHNPIYSIVFQSSEYEPVSSESLDSLNKSFSQEILTLHRPLSVELQKKEVTEKQRAANLGSIILKQLKKSNQGTTSPPEPEEETEVPPTSKEPLVTTPQPVVPVPVPTALENVVLKEDGSVELPPSNVGNFVGVPEGALFPPSSQEAGGITVTVVADNGLGDRIGSIYSGLVLAHNLKAKLHVLWNLNNECQARFSVLFKFDGTCSSVANVSEANNLEKRLQGQGAMFDAIITLKHHFSTAHLINHQEGTILPPYNPLSPWHCGESRKVDLEQQGQITRWALKRQQYVFYFPVETQTLIICSRV